MGNACCAPHDAGKTAAGKINLKAGKRSIKKGDRHSSKKDVIEAQMDYFQQEARR
jgi:hypothetical protein